MDIPGFAYHIALTFAICLYRLWHLLRTCCMDFKGVSRQFGENFKQGPFKALKKNPEISWRSLSYYPTWRRASGDGWGDCDPPQGGLQGPPCEVPTQNQKRWRNKNKKSWSLEAVKVFQLDQLNVLYLNISLGDGNSNIFYVHPYLGKWSQFDLRICFKWVGERPPTSDDMTFPTWNSHKNQAWQCR